MFEIISHVTAWFATHPNEDCYPAKVGRRIWIIRRGHVAEDVREAIDREK